MTWSARAEESLGEGRRGRGGGHGAGDQRHGNARTARGSRRGAWAAWAPLLCFALPAAAGGGAAEDGVPWHQNATCGAGNSGESTCSVFPTSPGVCFFRYNTCWISSKAINNYRTQIMYDEEHMLTNFSIWNLNGLSHILIWTGTDGDVPNQWIVETNEADEVHIYGLPAWKRRPEKERNFQLFNASNCVGCPSPQIKINPIPRDHILLFQIIPVTKYRKTLPNEEIIVHIFASNQTNYSNCNNLSENPTVSFKGSYNELLPIRGIYSQEFCIHVYFSPSNKQRFGFKFNMTETPRTDFTTTIPIPAWCPLMLVILITVLLTVIVYYYAVHKGWLKSRDCCVSHCMRSSSVATGSAAANSLLPMSFRREAPDRKVAEESALELNDMNMKSNDANVTAMSTNKCVNPTAESVT